MAEKAKEKLATFGADIDLDAFSHETRGHPYQDDPSAFSRVEQEQMLKAGVDITGKNQVGTFVQKDLSVVHCNTLIEPKNMLSRQQPL